MLSLGCKHEALIAAKAGMLSMVVMINPTRQARAEFVDESQRCFGEPLAQPVGRECKIENNDASDEIGGPWQFTGACKDQSG
jgi:hypothetical protein